MRKSLMLGLMVVAATILVNCGNIVVNVYFPASEVKRAVAQYEDEVRASGRGEEVETLEVGETPVSWSFPVSIEFGMPSASAAEGINLEVSTPAIRKILESRKARAMQIRTFLVSGNVGEGKDAMLVIRTSDGLKLSQRRDLKALVNAENKDRRSMYLELAKANNIDEAKLDMILKLVAKDRREKAEKNTWIQAVDGTWSQK